MLKTDYFHGQGKKVYFFTPKVRGIMLTEGDKHLLTIGLMGSPHGNLSKRTAFGVGYEQRRH